MTLLESKHAKIPITPIADVLSRIYGNGFYMSKTSSDRILHMFKESGYTKVTISSNGRSYQFRSMSDCAAYLSRISTFTPDQVLDMLMSREGYVCGFKVSYE